jgi:hypothetical protein
MCRYGIVNGKIKDFLRNHNNSYQVGSYSMTLKVKDTSTFKDELIPYMLDNKLGAYVEEVIDESKIAQLVNSGEVERESILPFVQREKTYLSVSIDKKGEMLENCKEQYEKVVENNDDLISLIRERKRLSLTIDETKNSYYSLARWLKWHFTENNMREYQFNYNGYAGIVRINTSERTYDKNNFIRWMKLNNIDGTKLEINHEKLKKSKNKKIKWDYVNSFKEESIDETLWINEVRNDLFRF